MNSTETDLRKRHQERTNETPEIGEEDEDPPTEIPAPSIERRHLLAIGVVVAILVAIYLYHRYDTGGQSLDGVRSEPLDPEATIEDSEDEEIHVPHESGNPLAGDEAVTEEFRDREIISGED
jgi:hypothetical protein